MVNPIQPIFTSKFYDWIFFFAFLICLKTTTECNRKWVCRLKVNDLNVICILLMQRQSITHEKYFLFIFYVSAYLSTEVKPIYHFINLTLNSPTPPGVLSQKSTNYFFTHDDTIILCFHMMYLILWIRSFLLDYLNQISNLCFYYMSFLFQSNKTHLITPKQCKSSK